SDGTETGRIEIRGRRTEVDHIERVGQFCPEFQLQPFHHREDPEETQVHELLARTVQDIAAGIAVCAGDGRLEGCRIEPGVRNVAAGAVGVQLRVAHYV